MEFVLGGVAAIGAGFFTNPLDVIKTRLQLQGELKARESYTVHYRGFFHAFYAVAKADGVLALQKGLVPALWYQLFLNGVRLGTYDFAEKRGWTSNKKGEVSIPKCMIVGALAGVAGAFSGSPFYLVKTHLQSQASESIAVGYQHKHAGSASALQDIYKKHGIVGLWRGATSSMPRVAIGSASQLVTIFLCKEHLNQYEVFEKRPLFNTFVSSLIGGIAITSLMTPFDVIMTRLYNQGTDAQGRGLLYKGIIDCFLKMWKTEGVHGFYKGFMPNYIRLGPHTVLCFVFWDALRGLQFTVEYHRRLGRVMEFILGGIAAIGAGFFTNPLDVIKTRLQLQGELQARGLYTVHYRGFFHAFYAVAKGDGILALQKGLVPALWYQLVMNGVRLGGYDFVEKRGLLLNKKGETSLIKATIASAFTGCASAYIASPFYLVKTHLQSKSAESVAVGYQHKHSGSASALWKIYKENGIVGLWRGVGSAMPRAGVGSASQLVSFSLCKEYLDQLVFSGRPMLNTFTSSIVGGVAITTLMTPFDVIMTRLYNQGTDIQGRGILYRGVLDCSIKMWKTEGFFGFYKGFIPNYIRLGPHTILCFHGQSYYDDLVEDFRAVGHGLEACSSPTFCQRLCLASSRVVLRLAILSTTCPIYTFIHDGAMEDPNANQPKGRYNLRSNGLRREHVADKCINRAGSRQNCQSQDNP
ncbi:hypothetical protein L9F63_018389 [Diploptera punctata]|uniref:Solute carrier family 25 member 35 n=1 Tax=Diploptera punctata TaxID=6984 RepID=A0AAD7ZX09_DIPPU|nr:hypothetical protein L9F63_018389 [Diploptera punctata]